MVLYDWVPTVLLISKTASVLMQFTLGAWHMSVWCTFSFSAHHTLCLLASRWIRVWHCWSLSTRAPRAIWPSKDQIVQI